MSATLVVESKKKATHRVAFKLFQLSNYNFTAIENEKIRPKLVLHTWSSTED